MGANSSFTLYSPTSTEEESTRNPTQMSLDAPSSHKLDISERLRGSDWLRCTLSWSSLCVLSSGLSSGILDAVTSPNGICSVPLVLASQGTGLPIAASRREEARPPRCFSSDPWGETDLELACLWETIECRLSYLERAWEEPLGIWENTDAVNMWKPIQLNNEKTKKTSIKNVRY